MTDTETSTETQGTDNAEIAGAQGTETTPAAELQPTEVQPAEVTQPEIQSEAVIAFLKSQGHEIESIDDLKRAPQVVEKEVAPAYDKFLSEEDRLYFKFAEETNGRSREEYNKLKVDYDKADPLELARERVRKDNGLPNLTDEQVDDYIVDTLGIDLEQMSGIDQIKLAGYAKPIKEERIADQQKYLQPIEKQPEQPQQAYNPENYVSLPNGSVMTKEAHVEMENKINEHIGHVKTAVRSIESQTFTIEVEENGEKKAIPFTYDFSQEDHDGMSAFAEDLITGKFVEKYRTETGFDHKAFVKDLVINPTIGKMYTQLLQSAHATAVEQVMKQNGNHSFTAQLPQHSLNREGVVNVPFSEVLKGRRN